MCPQICIPNPTRTPSVLFPPPSPPLPLSSDNLFPGLKPQGCSLLQAAQYYNSPAAYQRVIWVLCSSLSLLLTCSPRGTLIGKLSSACWSFVLFLAGLRNQLHSVLWLVMSCTQSQCKELQGAHDRQHLLPPPANHGAAYLAGSKDDRVAWLVGDTAIGTEILQSQ